MPKTVVGYWDIRGLAEPARLMLEYAGVEYDDKRYGCQLVPPYDRSAWTGVKQTIGLDFPNLPYFIDGDVKITESWAILKYIGRNHDLLPAKGEEHMADMLEGVVGDFRKSFTTMCYTDYDGQCETFFGKTLPGKLDAFEAFLVKHNFVGGSKLSYVDFALCEILNQMQLAKESALDGHPKVKAYVKKFDDLEKIKSYRNSKRFKKMPCNNPMAKWGGKPDYLMYKQRKMYKHMTGYNLFCSSLQGNSNIKVFSEKWRQLTNLERKSWSEKAHNFKESPPPTDMTDKKLKKFKRQQLEIIENACKALHQVNCEVGGLAYADGELQIFGTPKSAQMLNKNLELQRHFVLNASNQDTAKHCQQASMDNSVSDLRKQVQAIFNEKYSLAKGVKARMPYSQKRKLQVTGLPSGLEIKYPSAYGKKQCLDILGCKDEITITILNDENSNKEAAETSSQIVGLNDQNFTTIDIQTSAEVGLFDMFAAEGFNV